MKYRMLVATALTCSALGGAVVAQTQEEGKVLVDLVNVQTDIAAELGVDATQVPMTVMAPIDVAAAACGEDASTLAQNSTGANEGSGDDGSTDASGSGDAGADASGGSSVDSDGGDAAQGCIASASSPELAAVVQQEMSGTTTSP